MSTEIHKLIGEATAYDKKQMLEVKRPKSWLKSVSAFANGEGGTLIFGISDDDEIVGLADAESDAEKISEPRMAGHLTCHRWGLYTVRFDGFEAMCLAVTNALLTKRISKENKNPV